MTDCMPNLINKVKIHTGSRLPAPGYNQWRIQDFPGGSANFCQKLHENGTKLDRGGRASLAPPPGSTNNNEISLQQSHLFTSLVARSNQQFFGLFCSLQVGPSTQRQENNSQVIYFKNQWWKKIHRFFVQKYIVI